MSASMLGLRREMLCKFPAFDNDWDDAKRLAWFDDFAKLMELAREEQQREEQEAR